jgi:hypothetical protein
MSASESSVIEPPKGLFWGIGVVVLIIILGILAVGWYWSIEPMQFDVKKETLKRIKATSMSVDDLPTGTVFTNTLAHIAEMLMNKPGGYLTNDVAPPGILLDDIPSFEFGALVMLRDAASALRNHHARSQSQSAEDPDLARAEPYFYYEHDSWALPSTEAEYQKGIEALYRYMRRLSDPKAKVPAHFYARADNLWQHSEIIIKRLGGLSTRLTASTERYETLLQKQASLSTGGKMAVVRRTEWMEIDNVFWEARGAAWALLHILKAIKYDFRDILLDKRADKTVDQMIHAMEAALEPVLSPMILNGNGFGIFANYSLTMANYIARANASALDLRDIMNRG